MPPTRRRVMRAISGSNTAPERRVSSVLHRLGYRFRRNVPALPGKPDFVFTRRKKIIFVHGCFWHSHQACGAAKVPATRKEYWESKLKATVIRDEKVRSELLLGGWLIMTIWECELRDAKILIERLIEFLGPARSFER
ncbi:very short patch repair endonuclease [Rhodoblastus acidophilus]|uniref:Very short patch repair endonuclease n=1 Tax=Candidatus Rhodoblastus alkanivorans TaxID=2954117 RepID=A0ABS9Z8G6_9HYPH|nr:very short patch repair endonuclease [Candidatus Rhodoblastus alkanivorans]MCI4683655.1 very short patch repair endonuclease [Candidatus Rhodoblastus alkanivorans]MDI4640971.1 very short patch repair endonuclease [Rhodoblastus acidophilus]